MGSKLPREIKLEVLRKWLEGNSRDIIAFEVRIGTGTVSGIIKEFRTGDFDADLLREVALHLKNRGLTIQSFVPLVRLREVLEEMEWILGVIPEREDERAKQKEAKEGETYDYSGYDNYENELDQFVETKMESLIMSLEVYCYKDNLSAKQFFDCIHSMYLTAKKIDVPLEDFPSYIEQQAARIESVSQQIKNLELEKQAALEKYQTTEKLVEEFSLSRPMFDEIQRLKQELQQVTLDRDKYKFEMENERFWKRKNDEFEWSIPEPELEKANEELFYRTGPYKKQVINPKHLKEMVMDLYHRPSKYVDIIGKLMER
jgi:hypothetical protein